MSSEKERERERERETLTPIQITSAAAGEPPPSGRIGGRRGIPEMLELMGRLAAPHRERIGTGSDSVFRWARVADSEHEPVHGMMVQVQEMEGVIK